MNLSDLNIDKSWTLFLDRDGVINRRIIGGYVTRWEEFEFLPGVLESLKILAKQFGNIVVVSNQQGIGKGIMNAEDVEKIHSSMIRQVEGARGRIDLVLYSPHLESEGSEMRKPAIGMALEAQRMFPEIDFNKSVMVGDSETDIQFGRNAGMITVLLGNCNAIPVLPNHSCQDLLSFTRMVQRNH